MDRIEYQVWMSDHVWKLFYNIDAWCTEQIKTIFRCQF